MTVAYPDLERLLVEVIGMTQEGRSVSELVGIPEAVLIEFFGNLHDVARSVEYREDHLRVVAFLIGVQFGRQFPREREESA